MQLAALDFYAGQAARSAAMNMAIDEALLQSATVPTIRFYRWRGPALSFGYFGQYADVVEEEGAREIVRRWTGGGIVLHGADLTYSVILPQRGEPLPPSRAVYAQIHEAIRTVLARAMPAALAGGDAPKVSESCFANPVTADVLVHGRKIAGAAQRRTRTGLLHQGSIQGVTLPANFPEAFAGALCPDFVRRDFHPELIQRATELTERKYGTNDWLHRR